MTETVSRPADLAAEQRWENLVRARRDDVVAVDDEGSLGYGEVDLLAAELGGQLGLLPEVDPGAPVAVLAGHDRRSVVAALACARSARPRVVLDPSVPVPRLLDVVGSSGAQVVLADPALAALAAELGFAHVLHLDVSDEAVVAAQQSWPDGVPGWAPRDPDGIQGITYTSGSTGAPKGVAVRWRTTPYDLGWRVEDGWCREGDVAALVMPLSFGAAQGELTASLLLGASVHFYDPRARGVGPLPEWLERSGVTVLMATPSLLTALARTVGEATLSPSLRMIRSGGEKILCSEAVAIRAALPPGCRLINAFGSSEATLISAYEIGPDTPDLPRPVPAGRPLPGRELRIEREDGTESSPGEPGELIVISSELPAGYWRDEVRTAQRYTLLPDGRTALRTGDNAVWLPDGSFRLAGRKDLAVKIRGNLVEPAEVEVALLHCTGVRAAVVVGGPGRAGHDRLVGYVVYEPGAVRFRPSQLRRELLERLPAYMVPEALVYLTELPRNERGKLDRSALPAPSRPVPADDEALTPWQDQVAAQWCVVLQLDSVCLEDDFFDLGGDSLAAEELVTRMASELGVRMDSRTLVEAPSLVEFAALASSDERTDPHDSGVLVAVRPSGSRPALFFVPGAGSTGLRVVPVSRHLDPDQPVYGLQAPARGRFGLPEWFVRRTARRNIAVVRSVVGRAPVALVGHSFGAVVAFEMAQALRASGQEVALLVTLDSFAPHPRELAPVRRRSAREWVATLRRFAGTAAATERPDLGDFQPQMQQSRAAAMLYRGRPYGGRTLVVVAQDDQGAMVDRRGSAWAPYLTGAWRVALTPGSHTTMLLEPHAVALASLIEGELAVAREA